MKNFICIALACVISAVVAGNACANTTVVGVAKAVKQGQKTVNDTQSFISHPTISGGAKTLLDGGSFGNRALEIL